MDALKARLEELELILRRHSATLDHDGGGGSSSTPETQEHQPAADLDAPAADPADGPSVEETAHAAAVEGLQQPPLSGEGEGPAEVGAQVEGGLHPAAAA